LLGLINYVDISESFSVRDGATNILIFIPWFKLVYIVGFSPLLCIVLNHGISSAHARVDQELLVSFRRAGQIYTMVNPLLLAAAEFGDQVGSDTDIPTDYRIGPTALTVCGVLRSSWQRLTRQVSIFVFLAIAILVVVYRTFLRIKTFGRLGLDDIFMIIAVVLFAGSTGITQSARDLNYLQLNVNLGRTPPPADFAVRMLLNNKLNTAEATLQWSTIFMVKFSYMLFFRPLTSRLRFLQIWWWAIIGILTPSFIVIIAVSIWVCGYFDMSFIGGKPDLR
jgi:hypothetical protein